MMMLDDYDAPAEARALLAELASPLTCEDGEYTLRVAGFTIPVARSLLMDPGATFGQQLRWARILRRGSLQSALDRLRIDRGPGVLVRTGRRRYAFVEGSITKAAWVAMLGRLSDLAEVVTQEQVDKLRSHLVTQSVRQACIGSPPPNCS